MFAIKRDHRDGRQPTEESSPGSFTNLARALEILDLDPQKRELVAQRFGDLYRQLVQKGVSIVEQGRTGGWGSNTEWLNTAVAQEQTLGKELGLSQDRILDVRHLLLATELLEQLRLFPQQNALMAREVMGKVRDRTIDSLLDFNSRPGQPSLMHPDCRAEIGDRYLGVYLRPLVFLEVVRANPGIVEDLHENSSYSLHLHFVTKVDKPPSKAQVTRESDLIVARQIVSLVSEDFGDRLNKASELFVVVPTTTRPTSRTFAGPYSLQYGIGFEFKSKESEALLEVAQAIDRLFGKPEQKKELLTTIAETMALRVSTLAANEADLVELLRDRKSAFALTKAQFAVVRGILEKYAHNQIVSSYLGSQGTFVARPYLASMLRIWGEANESGLVIHDQNGSARHLSQSSSNPYYNTKQDLPVSIAALSLWYTKALEICKAADSNPSPAASA